MFRKWSLSLCAVFIFTLLAVSSIPSATAYPSGTITITSYPSTWSDLSQVEFFTVTTHAKWSGLSQGEIVSVGLIISPTYNFGGSANEMIFVPNCQSSCQGSSSNGELNSTFVVSGKESAPGYSYYLFPSGFIAYASLQGCITSISCTTITSSRQVVIGPPCAFSGQLDCIAVSEFSGNIAIVAFLALVISLYILRQNTKKTHHFEHTA